MTQVATTITSKQEWREKFLVPKKILEVKQVLDQAGISLGITYH